MAKYFIVAAFVGATIAGTSSAQAGDTIATCSAPSGYSLYHHTILLDKKNSGFTEDKISGGLTSLVKINKEEYDLMFVDTRQQIISTVQDGGMVRLIRNGKDDATFLAVYPGMSIELYTFYREADGKERYDMLQSKGGDGMPIHKSALLTGECSVLNLELVN